MTWFGWLKRDVTSPEIEEQKRIGESLKAETEALKPLVEEVERKASEKADTVTNTVRRAQRRVSFETAIINDMQSGWGGRRG